MILLNLGFLVDDTLVITPNKGLIEPGGYKLIKAVLTPKFSFSKYDGDIQVKITWNNNNNDNLRGSEIIKPNQINQSINANINVNMSQPLSNLMKIEKQFIYLRLVKDYIFEDLEYPQYQKEESNTCFIEKILQEQVKSILTDPKFQEEFLEKIDEQPLSLFAWTDDSEVSTQSDVRERYINNIKKEVSDSSDNLSIFTIKRNSNFGRNVIRHPSSVTKNINKEDSRVEDINFNEEEDGELQDKYYNDLVHKYKLSINEVNEKLIVVNEDSRKVISDVIMENTIYNIISEAVYGETNLTEKPRIYFFNNKK